MSINKIKTNTGEKWEVRVWLAGRGSKRIRRRFDRKVDALNFYSHYKNESSGDENNIGLLQKKPIMVFFGEEANAWIESNKHRFSPGHLKRVLGILKKINSEFSKMPISKINAQILTEFQKSLLQDDYAPASVNRITEVITAIINNSVRANRISKNPAMGFKKLTGLQEEMQFWEKAEAESFLSFADHKYQLEVDRWNFIVYLLALNTGLRAGEIWGLKVCDLVEDGKTLFIRRQFNRVTKSFDFLKGKRNSKQGKMSRHVPCSDELRMELKNLVTKNGLSVQDTFFRNQKNNPIDHDGFREKFERDLKDWGGRRIRFHDLRHTAITLLISYGIDLKTVQEIAGHEDIKTTMNYVHLVGDSIKRVADVFKISSQRKRDGDLRLISG